MNACATTGGLLLAAMLAMGARADPVEDSLRLATEAYRGGDYPAAASHLGDALEQVKRLADRRYLDLLPAPPEGWEAFDGEVQTDRVDLLGGGTGVQRHYFRESEQVRVEMLLDSPLLAGLSFAVENPEMLATDGATRAYSYKGYRGVTRSDDARLEVSLIVSERVLFKVTGTGLEDRAVLDLFLDATEFERIEALSGS